MQRYAEVRQAYQRIGIRASRYDGMMTNSSMLGRLALRLFWGLPEENYRKYIAQAFSGIPAGFDGRMLEANGTAVLEDGACLELAGVGFYVKYPFLHN